MRLDRSTEDAAYLLSVIPRASAETAETAESHAEPYSADTADSAEGFTVSRRDLFTAASRGRFKHADDLDEPIAVLVDHGYLAPVDQPATKGPGRKPSPRWHVHPSLTTWGSS